MIEILLFENKEEDERIQINIIYTIIIVSTYLEFCLYIFVKIDQISTYGTNRRASMLNCSLLLLLLLLLLSLRVAMEASVLSVLSRVVEANQRV